MDTERLGNDPSGKGRNGGEELKDTKLPIPTPRKSGGFFGVFEGRDGRPVSAYVIWKDFNKRTRDMHEVAKIESKLRSERDNEQRECGMSGLARPELVPVDPVRLDGKNYPIWARRMEFFLKELKVEYVLYKPCPSIIVGSVATSLGLTELKAAEEKWIKDDFLGLRTILNYLCDDLLHRYGKRKKTTTAKQLWDDLKLMFGTKKYLVRKYMDFQMVDEKPLVEQIQEFNHIFDELVASGMTLSETFHVSAILSKLPASWKHVIIKSKYNINEPLTLEVLMDHLRIEEEYVCV
ncbi:hypothetical protein CerSpe_084300 [Prunus speciosa]